MELPKVGGGWKLTMTVDNSGINKRFRGNFVDTDISRLCK